MITREAMERIVASGSSVLYHGVVISRVEDLPSVAALEKRDFVAHRPGENGLEIAADDRGLVGIH